MKIKTALLLFCLFSTGPAFCSDVMVERMQSVVDEVSELRLRYEQAVDKNRACIDQIQEQNKVIKKISMDAGVDYRLFEENRKRLAALEAENLKLKKSTNANNELEAIHKEFNVLEKENKRLNTSAQILLEKNNSLIEQVNTLKRKHEDDAEKKIEALEIKVSDLKKQLDSSKNSAVTADRVEPTPECTDLKKDKVRLQKELESSMAKECKPKKMPKFKAICLDENPFPQLMMKKEKDIQPVISKEKVILPHKNEEDPVIDLTPVQENNTTGLKIEKPSTYRVKEESSVYNAPEGKVVKIWESDTSFTSNISQGKWIKVTGYFVNRKWIKNTQEMWVKEEYTLKR